MTYNPYKDLIERKKIILKRIHEIEKDYAWVKLPEKKETKITDELFSIYPKNADVQLEYERLKKGLAILDQEIKDCKESKQAKNG
jgi:uncharacterized protein YdeI (YjbR/CyaY-like superfamily)